MKRITRILISLLLLSSATLASANVRAEIYLVVSESSPIQTISRKEAIDLFTGRTRSVAGAGVTQLFDLSRDSQQRAQFYESLTGKSLAQINSYWSRLMFSGQNMPPQVLPSEDVMIEILRTNPNGLGYLSQRPSAAGLRTVLILKQADQ